MKYNDWVREQLYERSQDAKRRMYEAKEDAAWAAWTVGKHGYCGDYHMEKFKKFVARYNTRGIAFDAWRNWCEKEKAV